LFIWRESLSTLIKLGVIKNAKVPIVKNPTIKILKSNALILTKIIRSANSEQTCNNNQLGCPKYSSTCKLNLTLPLILYLSKRVFKAEYNLGDASSLFGAYDVEKYLPTNPS